MTRIGPKSDTSEPTMHRHTRKKITHLVTGLFTGLSSQGEPLVDFPDNIAGIPIVARSTVLLEKTDEGKEAALLFENGDPTRPLIVGLLTEPKSARTTVLPEVDGQVLTFSAEKQVVLRCGEASITLTKAGKIVIRGTYVLSRSSGVNMVKGATIQLN